MPRKAKKTNTAVTVVDPSKLPQRTAKGTWKPGFSGSAGLDVARARKQLNGLTIEAMTEAFRRGGREAINKTMKTHPAIFLKLLVLLVPRELEVTHSQGVKGMSDEQIENAIHAIEEMLAKRARGDQAKVIEGVAEVPSATST
jgi:hypothetical protein